MTSRPSTRTFLDAQEDLRAALPGYESRAQQQALATRIEHAIRDGQHLLAEAGTGTGKSLGYLIPAVQSGKRVVVSTATKALQDQIAGKDLPFLAEHLQEDFTHAILKGRSNYLCQAKAADPDVVSNIPEVRVIAETIKVRQADTDFLGEREDFPVALSDRDWRSLTTTSENCPGKRQCPFGDTCFSERAKQRAKEADIVVVNHALFLTDLRVRADSNGYGTMIGPYDVVVFDEAHEIEEYTGTIFGAQFTEAGVRQIGAEVLNWVRRHDDADGTLSEEFRTINANVMMALASLWEVLSPGRITSKILLDAADQFVEMTNALTAQAEWFTPRMADLIPESEYRQGKPKFDILRQRLVGLASRFQDVVLGDFDDFVRWVEDERVGTSGDTRRVIKSAPISASKILRPLLFDVTSNVREEGDQPPFQATAILASATLSVGGRFSYIADRLGIDEYDSVDVGTPFDYPSQSLLYVPRTLPDPTRERMAWQSMAIAEMRALVRASQGRALLLFTSYRAMKDAYEMIAPSLPYRCLMQGQMPTRALGEEFKNDTSSVLFATRSFMTGIDVQGESLSLVVIDKLPFPVPTDPLVEAKMEAVKRSGRSDFGEYTIPVMTLVLKQAFGRLIRHRNDRGVVAILDSRLRTKGYGRGILQSLPPARSVEHMDEVERFFADLT